MTDLTKWKKIRETSQKVGWRYVTEKIFIDPEGNEQSYTTWNRPNDKAAAVIALTPDNRVVIVQMYRQGPEKIQFDLPAGLVDEGEDIEAAARRELLEETGYVTDERLEYLGSYHWGAYNNLESHYFFARNCTQKVTPERIRDEYIVVNLISIEKLIQNAKSGLVGDAAAVLMAYEKLNEIQEGS